MRNINAQNVDMGSINSLNNLKTFNKSNAIQFVGMESNQNRNSVMMETLTRLTAAIINARLRIHSYVLLYKTNLYVLLMKIQDFILATPLE